MCAFDPRRLFQPWRYRDRGRTTYKNVDEVYDAVRDRIKGIERQSLPLEHVERGEKWFGDTLDHAFRRGLAVVLTPTEHRRHAELYVLPLDQAWRILALDVLHKDTGPGWGRAREAQESLLLGYSESERARWLAVRNDDRYWHGHLIFSLLTRAQVKVVNAHGRRCFATASAMTGMRFFHVVSDRMLRENALSIVPKGFTLARATVTGKIAAEMSQAFKREQRNLIQFQPTTEFARLINENLNSNVEFLTARGWR